MVWIRLYHKRSAVVGAFRGGPLGSEREVVNKKHKAKSKQFDNLGGFKFNYLIYVWGEGSLAKTEGSLAAPYNKS
uniref:Uncharacterized protein n=1 Tax=Hyaloperonospora arabidopsidis (strain Emoy2) TaxID=559515 RepID=M4BGP9_HYAAE